MCSSDLTGQDRVQEMLGYKQAMATEADKATDDAWKQACDSYR
mgnify:CR=1 FL=1